MNTKLKCLSKVFASSIIAFSLVTNTTAYAKNINSYTANYLNPNPLVNINSAETSMYNEIYTNIYNLNDSIDLSKYIKIIPNYKDKALNMYFNILNDHPEIFYVSNKINWSYGFNSFKLYINYIYPKHEIKLKKDLLNNEINKIILNNIKPKMTPIEKELSIHDFLVLNTKYDEKNYNLNTIPNIDHTAYGVLINHIGVCDGYSKAFKILLNKVGIKSIIISSKSMNHAWNIVTLNNHNYHVDVTWDDPIPDRTGIVSHKYFNLDDYTIKHMDNKHFWDELKYPKCSNNNSLDIKNNNIKNKSGWVFEYPNWYFLNSYGYSITGWLYNNGSWYFLNDNGCMETNWIYNNGSWYFLNNNGAMKTGWLYNNGHWYFLNNDGSMRIGWLYYNNNWYFLNNNGSMLTGNISINNRIYQFNSWGALI